MEFWGYKNEVRLRGLTENQDLVTRVGGCVFVYLRFQPPGARYESLLYSTKNRYNSTHPTKPMLERVKSQ